MTEPVLVWLRQDLRLADQAAFVAAAAEGPVIPVYVLDDETPRHRRMGGASRWWLHHSLTSLAADLRKAGSRLVLRRGRADEQLRALAQATGARRVHALGHAEPWWRNAERSVAKSLDLVLHPGQYLVPPGTLRTGSGQPYRIYTPFWRTLVQHMPPPPPVPAPDLSAPVQWPASDDLNDWQLLPTAPDWAAGMRQEWTPGEAGAQTRLDRFAECAARYGTARNLPSQAGTSKLSPHLHFGEISVARVWHAMAGAGGSVEVFLGELGWRDYAANVLWQFPDYATANAKPAFDRMDWRDAPDEVRAWQRGMTGYPIVDAGMRELWATGWMHNRVRMIAASFLVKHLCVDWREGERWFWDTLVDADHAANAVNWQWTAGTGVDAQMFVRIMAPLVQSPKFDCGDYIRRWVPELAHLPDPLIHDPPLRPRGYPAPIIGHVEARARALAAHDRLKADI
ncbi:deoxyribodipyrimidine photo-lyase [Novosphingobium sp. FSW06-99]|uniref:cryptochrome/photolyase family protein n=1 Tax=Novosphingobium sp. FSW06-99 TaxID=1739113 RepID=UPI00076D2A1A|nr:deoxyribodipyrimidine photo-lyase [Novosphingobium sp. FSW06-99]KUR80822.1 deoxyribodipyrimidine photolyase [Novosphingobium sp. FSW06-99]